jgi:hypothetical protein
MGVQAQACVVFGKTWQVTLNTLLLEQLTGWLGEAAVQLDFQQA